MLAQKKLGELVFMLLAIVGFILMAARAATGTSASESFDRVQACGDFCQCECAPRDAEKERGR